MPDYILPKFNGQIIYATPGSGKSFLKNEYGGQLVDGDEVLLQIIREITPYFEFLDNVHPFTNIMRFTKYAPNKFNLLYNLAEDRFIDMRNEGLIVLIGSHRLMHIADIVFIQTNPNILLNRNYDQSKELCRVDELLDDGTFHPGMVKRMNNYLEEYMAAYYS